MVAQKIQAQLSELQEKLKDIAFRLNALDEARLTAVEQFLTESEIERDLLLYQEFQSPTKQSIEEIGVFENLYLQVLAYVLLLEKEGHRNIHFQSLLVSYQLMEKKIARIKELRQKEIRYLHLLQRQKDSFALRFRFLRTGVERLLRRAILTEITILLLVINLARHGDEELQHLQAALRAEEQKEVVHKAIAGTLFLVPAVGTALYFLSQSLLAWMNQFTPNYKRLQKLLKKNK